MVFTVFMMFIMLSVFIVHIELNVFNMVVVFSIQVWLSLLMKYVVYYA